MSTTAVMAIMAEFIVPGVGSTIVVALSTLSRLCADMKESEGMCFRVLERLQFVSSELEKVQSTSTLRESKVLPTFGAVIAKFTAFLKKHSRKNPLSRLASNRKFMHEIQEFHAEINFLLKLLNVVHIAEMSAWRQQWEQDQAVARLQMQQLLTNTNLIILELSSGALVESLAELKYEIERKRDENAPDQVALMRSTFMTVVSTSKAKVPKIPIWFIPSGDVNCPDEAFDAGSYGSVHRGTWGHTNVVIKRMLMTSEQAQKSFFKETEIWSTFKNPHVITLYGGCHVSTPMFFVCEDATEGNFVNYFRDPINKRRMWQLFYQAACGVEYIHNKKVVHGDLKCNNLLVGADGLAKICDFGFSFIRRESVGLSTKPQTEATRWKALECLMGVGNEANPRFESDVYSLGMCIIEAVSGEVPWGLADDDTILDNLMSGDAHPRPSGLTDEQWDLVARMCAINKDERITLLAALDILKTFAADEKRKEETVEAQLSGLTLGIVCSTCQFPMPRDFGYCGKCGAQLRSSGKASLAQEVSP